MEQKTKNCPYCGEEILTVAKKCKHCGEWITEDESEEDFPPESPETEEDEFAEETLYDYSWVNRLFGVTVFGAVIQFLHNSDMAEGLANLNLHGKWGRALTGFASIPEWIGDLSYDIGAIGFLILLMKAFKHLHTPLTGLFVTSIILSALCSLLGLFDTDDDAIVVLGFLLFIASCIIDFILYAKIILNYEERIKQLGWFSLGYTAIIFVSAFLYASIAEPFFFLLALVGLICDVLYYRYLRNLLSIEQE